jgi:hypothetical protein
VSGNPLVEQRWEGRAVEYRAENESRASAVAASERLIGSRKGPINATSDPLRLHTYDESSTNEAS